METNLDKFNELIHILNKDFSEYKDNEKGIYFIFNTVNAIATVEYLELEKQDYTIKKFQKAIDDLEYNIIKIKKPVPKNVITGKDEDKYTIVEKEVDVRQVWNVSNRLGARKSFTNKDEAMSYAEDINKQIKLIIL